MKIKTAENIPVFTTVHSPKVLLPVVESSFDYFLSCF